jgi:glycolate oxidase
LPSDTALLLIEVDGPEVVVEGDAARIEEILRSHGATDVRKALDKKGVKDLWKTRRAMSAALFRLRPNKINEDVVVPRSRIRELVEGIEAIASETGLLIVSFGHAGDGNIHVNIMYDRKDEDEAAAAEKAVSRVFELVLGLGGTISGEHGVGITKSGYIEMELSPGEIAIMRGIKKTFDPKGILNPGKIFPPQREVV